MCLRWNRNNLIPCLTLICDFANKLNFCDCTFARRRSPWSGLIALQNSLWIGNANSALTVWILWSSRETWVVTEFGWPFELDHWVPLPLIVTEKLVHMWEDNIENECGKFGAVIADKSQHLWGLALVVFVIACYPLSNGRFISRGKATVFSPYLLKAQRQGNLPQSYIKLLDFPPFLFSNASTVFVGWRNFRDHHVLGCLQLKI